MIEIERKFLTTDNSYRAQAIKAYRIEQGYLSSTPLSVARVRIRTVIDVNKGKALREEAFITVKSKTVGCSRNEWEYAVPVEDARGMMGICLRSLRKTRWIVPYAGFTWEVDEFEGKNEGIVVAEIELPSEDTRFDKPAFIGDEVTGNPKYYNSNLASC